MNTVIERPSAHLQLAIDVVEQSGAIARQHYTTLTADQLGISRKGDNSSVTKTDIDISNFIVEKIYTQTGEPVITEEVDTVPAH